MICLGDLMKIVYDSLTGKTKHFASQLGFPVIDIQDCLDSNVQGPLFLVTRNAGYGEVPESTLTFMRKHYRKVIGIAVSSNRNWGHYYGAAGDTLERIYKIPLVVKFDGEGSENDVEITRDFISQRS